MQTMVPQDKIGQLVEGRYENPFELLGPHVVDDLGQPGVGGAGVPAAVDPSLGGRSACTTLAADASHPSGRTVRSDLPCPGEGCPAELSASRGRRGRKESSHARSLCVSRTC